MDNLLTLLIFFVSFSILLIFFTISNWTLSKTKNIKLKHLEENSKNSPNFKYIWYLAKNRERSLYTTYIYIIVTSFILGVCLYNILRFLINYLSNFLSANFSIIFKSQIILFPIASLSFLFLTIFFIDLIKGISSFNAEKTLTVLSPVLYYFCKIISFIPQCIINTNNKILKAFGKVTSKRTTSSVLSSKDIEDLVEESSQNGLIEKEEKELLKGVINFSDTCVKEIMTPRHKIVAVETDDTILEVSKIFSNEGFSRLVVYEKDLDNVKGMVLAKDILTYTTNNNHNINALNNPIKTLMRQVYFVREDKEIDSLLQEFRKKGNHLAVVLDEHGGVEGVITIEDLLEEIVGDIMDEHDILEQNQKNETQVTKNKGGAIIIPGFLSIHDYNESYKPIIPEGEYETVAGFMIKMLSKMPQKGDEFVYNDYIFIVNNVVEHRIDKIMITPILGK